MIEWLARKCADRDAASAVSGGVLEHLQKKRLGQVKAAASRIEQASRREQAHRPQVDVLVSARRPRNCSARLGERRRIQNDGIERDSFVLFLPQVIERIRL